ncbi:MAG: cytochrome c biogenesis protein CcsA [Bacteroidetes bacterium]|nr:cytochrome c biogenesis protein CcsA [Bacteroidota bacterium]
MEINYIGEHLLAGAIGRWSIGLSFVTALAATLIYILVSVKTDPGRLKVLARALYIAHLGLLVVAFAALYYLIFNHVFAYNYVLEYSSKELPLAFLISSLWAGQEGSFMLWALFQALLGVIILKKARNWEAPILTVVSLSQVFLLLMVLGWKVFGITLGTDPFILIRKMPSSIGNSFFNDPAYLQQIADGQGLNPLLENIWMAIHPPLLFLGYAAVLIPFGYAVAGLWKRDHKGWRTPALPWINFAALSLGVGIILGAAWAYVALTFGGFWSWDPVENASLVPWLFTIATMHVLLISRKKPQNLFWTYLFAILSYVFVLYASYLTRSGVLKDSSAHAFGDEGKAIPLVIFTLTFLVTGLILLILRHPKTTDKVKENLHSKDFWIFIGSLILMLSSFQIILTTSIPVVNKIFGTNLAPPTDSISYYNSWQLPYGILIALLIGLTQYMKYGEKAGTGYLRRSVPALITAAVVSILFIFVFPFKNILHYFFLFFIVFMLYSSLEALLKREKKQRNPGALITHFGLSVFLFGVLVTFSHTKVITGKASAPASGMGNMAENQVLIKNDTVDMGPYKVIYKDRKEDGKWLFYTLDFYSQTPDGRLEKRFTLNPSINRNEKMGYVYEPDTRHQFSKDIFGYITFAQNLKNEDIKGYIKTSDKELGLHDSLVVNDVTVFLDSIQFIQGENNAVMGISAALRAKTEDGMQNLKLQYLIEQQSVRLIHDSLPGHRIAFGISNVLQQGQRLVIGVYSKENDYIVMKVILFPFISLMWIGSIIIFAGICVALWKRLSNKKLQTGTKEQAETINQTT